MNNLKYKWILYIIVFVILGTIGVQGYWNYKNYQSNKQQLINDVQLSLDTAVESYFANLAESKTFAFAFEADSLGGILAHEAKMDSLIRDVQIFATNTSLDSLDNKLIEGVSLFKNLKKDTIIEHLFVDNEKKEWQSNKIVLKRHFDSTVNPTQLEDFKMLTSKVLISMTRDSLKLDKINGLLKEELSTKTLDIDYKLLYRNELNKVQETHKGTIVNTPLVVTSKSTFLPRNTILKVHFTNDTKIILKRMLSSLFISTFLVLAVISSLFYLLKIIKHQKQIAEVKNDLISNITHEFKTPIATIGVALESIKNFNVIDDKEKTKSYLDMSNNQLSKLNVMVEKLLETATLDSENLNLNKEEVNITDLINVLVNKHQMQTNEKTIRFSLSKQPILAKVDIFHFENTINNILDNAIKYGGDTINIDVFQNSFSFTVSVSDNGKTLTKANKEKIFEKFYRIPKGNTHDIKGFGIGLYYAKKITEKHGGAMHLNLSNTLTTFKITLPNE